MALVDAVSQVFQANGLLASCLPAHVVRDGQTEMAIAVARNIETGGVLVVEAGTGIGKTFAYLVPALLSGQRVLVSTATKALQDQLFQHDLPRLKSMLGVTVRVAQLKGRSSYLCLYRLNHARLDALFDDPFSLQELAAVESWAVVTRSGDLAEVAALSDQSPVNALVSSTRDNCLGGRCPNAADCHLNLARRNAMSADLVVVNHHLFFADLRVKESGIAELLPTVHSVIFDEAHQLNDIGVQFMGVQFSTNQLDSFVSEVQSVTTTTARGFADWHGLLSDLNRAVNALRAMLSRSTRRIGWSGNAPLGTNPTLWISNLGDVAFALEAIKVSLEQVGNISPDLGALFERAVRLQGTLSLFQSDCDKASVRWVEVDSSLRLFQAPLNIADAMHSEVFTGCRDEGGVKSWVFTSATLGHDSSLRLFVESCGLTDAKIVKIPSPFDYAAQAGLFIPEDFPAPFESLHSLAVAKLAVDGAVQLSGKTMVLTTSLKAMQLIGKEVRAALAAMRSDLVVLIQGDAPKREIIRKMSNPHPSSGCVVVASASFWEGVDLPGSVLQLLLLDKLPFAPPDDPIHESRSQQLEQSGKNAFRDLHLPLAAIALKQGAGRLIRRETDKGVLVVCDTRLVTKGYGKKLLAALPPMRRLHTLDDYNAAIHSLTRLSTMGLG